MVLQKYTSNIGLFLIIIFALLFPHVTYAADGITLFTLNNGSHTEGIDIKIEILALMTVIGFIPIIIVMMTPFTRIIIVLSILRQALGLQQSPPNKVLIGISLILTVFIMRPIGEDIYANAYRPYDKGDISISTAIEKAELPIKKFMLAQTRKTDLEQMEKISKTDHVTNTEQVSFFVLLPAYVLSELKTSFQIGFLIYLPFLVIDMVVASVLMSMGMMMLSPLIISLPFKLLVFVMVDGWSMIVSTLATSFG